MWDDLPNNVAWFVRQLASSGFVETHREAGTMDSGLIAYRRDPIEIRLVKDRSQWSVDLMSTAGGSATVSASRCSTASRWTRRSGAFAWMRCAHKARVSLSARKGQRAIGA
jgi:hypothetical protein